ncbi:di-heme oxidoredictase family protein [Sneathiella limimaris]|uniref:di-heme oxidoreductase family protein n=1 Tax=Sneathiella limimaris TaxID=1964213 RepID=UPI003B837F3D
MTHKTISIWCAFFVMAPFVLSSANADPFTRDDLNSRDKARVAAIVKATDNFTRAEQFEKMQGGAATTLHSVGRDSFSQFSANLDFEGEQQFKLGNGLFRKLWVSSPSSTAASDGLGPLFNARSCQRCHLKDGRGHPPESMEDSAVSMFLRLAIKPQTAEDEALIQAGTKVLIEEPTYGGQLQDLSISEIPPEGKMVITYEEVPVELAGGEIISLRKPTYSVSQLGYGPLHKDVLLSPRVAPQMIGLGLLEAIHVNDILSKEDPEDRDGDGISGRASWIGDDKASPRRLGRFGWKAGAASVREQSAGAFAGDIGISTILDHRHYGDCTAAQSACLEQKTGVQKRLGDVEAPDPVLKLVTFYSKNLAPPARRDFDDPEVLKGKALFYEAGCVSCHTPKFVTSRNAEQKEHRFQLIWPYTDLLLHDMGEGLADHFPVGSASGTEWKTPPLWGIGLTDEVNGHTYFLHDGRARNLTEAILWHGGEAEAAKEQFRLMSPLNRTRLIRFLESL